MLCQANLNQLVASDWHVSVLNDWLIRLLSGQECVVNDVPYQYYKEEGELLICFIGLDLSQSIFAILSYYINRYKQTFVLKFLWIQFGWWHNLD